MRLTIITLALALAACGEADPADPADATTSDATTVADVTTEVAPDGTVVPDVTVAPDVTADVVHGDGTVAGTQLAGIAVTFAPLELCSAWNEGASLADEQARKVRITVAGKVVSTLDEAALAEPLSGVVVATGPDHADRMRPVGEATSTVDYALTSGAGGLGTTLYVSVVHVLAGGAGTLTESYYVARSDVDRRPVVIGPSATEVLFTYQPADATLAPTRLERCDVGLPSAEDAVSVIVAKNTSTKQWAALVRYWRTNDTDAGSAPATLVGHRLITSDSPWQSDDAVGFWSATYAAAHHNFDESVDVDYTRDLGKWHTVFRDPDPLATPVAEVSLAHLRNPSGATLVVERLVDGARTSVTYDVVDPMNVPRVDATALRRTLAWEDGRVVAAGGTDHWFQMLLCPGLHREELVAVVPVVWSPDITRAGERIEGAAITAKDGGWDVAVGDLTLQIRRDPDDFFRTQVLDASGTMVTGTSEQGYTLGRWPEAMRAPLSGTSKDGQVSFAIARRWAGYGVGKSQLYAPELFTLTIGAATYSVDAWDALTYTNTHHNWADTLEGVADDGTHIHWRVSFFDGIDNELSATDADGNVVLAPTVIDREDEP